MKNKPSELLLGWNVTVFSERVGWIPVKNEIPEAVQEEYKWVEGLSVTEMEIMHGAYRKDNPNGRQSMRTGL